MYDDIRPYNDQETSAALKRASNNPLIESISAFLFPGKDPDILKNTLNTISGVDDFQTRVMYPAVRSILSKTTKGITVEGLEHFASGKCFTMLSSHRDIVLDSAFIQYVFKDHGMPLSEIAVGDNLIANQFIDDLMRSNRMIKVVRSTNPREVYTTSRTLSQYMRERVNDAESPASIWISHRNGRTKDGVDTTEQGLLKMLSMSGGSDFVENMEQVSIMPVAISYEIESCGVKKAYEVFIKKSTGTYVKRPGEDVDSIITGIIQQKGRVHLAFCKPITHDELVECAALDKNDRFRHLAQIIDKRILDSYKVWPNNIAAAEIVKGVEPSSPMVTAEFEKFIASEINSLEKALAKARIDKEAVVDNLLRIYANPALRKGLV